MKKIKVKHVHLIVGMSTWLERPNPPMTLNQLELINFEQKKK